MTWQDSLRQLDARLANGEIGAAEYRKTRDEILAEASSGTQQVSFDAEVTTQWVSTPPPQPAAAEAPAADSDEEPTQVVAADVVTTPPPPQMPPPPQQQFGPPMPPQMQRPAPPIMGSEVFGEARASGGGGKKALWFLVTIVVLALIGGGVWWFALRDDSTPPSAQNQQEQTTTTAPTTTSQVAEVPKAADVAEQVPRLPGQAKPENGTMTTDEARQKELLNPAYAQLLADGGAKEIVYNKSSGDGYGYLLMAAPVEPAGHAADLVTATSDNLTKSGFTTAASGSGQPPVYSRTDKFFRTFVVMYASGDVWVQLNVSAAPDGDENALRTEFDNVLQQVLEQLPAR